jgi:hypothetical protein
MYLNICISYHIKIATQYMLTIFLVPHLNVYIQVKHTETCTETLCSGTETVQHCLPINNNVKTNIT